jgi:putative membrane protein
MRYILWLLKFALFVLVLSFAVKNTDTVMLHYYLGYNWEAPLVVVALIFFCVGAVAGILASLTHLFRLRREVSALKRELRAQARISDTAPPDAV